MGVWSVRSGARQPPQGGLKWALGLPHFRRHQWFAETSEHLVWDEHKKAGHCKKTSQNLIMLSLYHLKTTQILFNLNHKFYSHVLVFVSTCRLPGTFWPVFHSVTLKCEEIDLSRGLQTWYIYHFWQQKGIYWAFVEFCGSNTWSIDDSDNSILCVIYNKIWSF